MKKDILMNEQRKINLIGSLPFIGMHAACLLVFVTGVSWAAVVICCITLFTRMFGLTAGYHRYFCHKSYKTSRIFQFILAWLGASAVQMGPLWWAAHHRHHHLKTDTDDDEHSPHKRGFFWAHMGWVMCDANYTIDTQKRVPDFAKYPELRFIDKYPLIPPAVLFVLLAVTGFALDVSVAQVIVWGFFVSTVILYHITFSINSFAHMFGSRRFELENHSRNNWVLGLLAMGEGWHNNHHRYSISERQGFYWWEIDMTHYILTVLSWLHIVWDINKPPAKIFTKNRLNSGAGNA